MASTPAPAAPVVSAWRCAVQGASRCKGDLTVGRAPKKCRECGGILSVQDVVITAQPWRGDARYSLAAATRTFRRLADAERFIATDEALVVRLVSA